MIRSEQAAVLPRQEGFELTGVEVEERTEAGTRTLTAKRAIVEASPGDSLATSGLQIVLREVQFSDGNDWIERSKETLGPIRLSSALVTQLEAMSDAELMQASRAVGADDPLGPARAAAEEARGETLRRIAGTVHERTAFSVSVVFLVILGVALGIVFRGSHVMTAFGISFVPSLVVIVTIVMGKQVTNNPASHGEGLWLLWSGVIIVVALDLFVVTKVLRR